MRIIKIAFAILVLTVSILGQRNTSVTGKVIRGGQPVPDAAISLTSLTNKNGIYKTVTDRNGNFSLSNVPTGHYLLRADSCQVKDVSRNPGLSWQREIAVSRNKDEVLKIDFDTPAPIREEVVVVAAGSDQPLNAVSKSVDMIGASEMRERADFALVDSLRTIPGFRVQQLGGFGRAASIKTRGLRNQDTAVLIDGVRFRDAASITGDATPFLSDFTLTSVSRIEVLRGSDSSLYGTNAIGGVIDLQTPEPQPGLHGQISGAAGGSGLGRFRGNLSDGTSDGRFAFNLGVSRTAYTKGIDGQDNSHNTNFQSKLNYRLTINTNLSGRFFVSDAFVRLNADPDTLGDLPFSKNGIIIARPAINFIPDQNDPDSFQSSQFFNGQFVFTHIFSPKVVLQAYYSGLRTSRKNDNGPLGPGFQSASTSLFNGLIQDVNAHVDWSSGRINKLTAGYEFEYEKFGNHGGTASGLDNFFTKAYQSSNTFYLQDLISLLEDRLNIAGGFRGQYFNLADPKFSLANQPYSSLSVADPPAAYTFDGSAAYLFRSTGTKIRGHVGSGYRVPSLYERFGTFFSNFGKSQFVALGDPNLKPEKSIAYDTGVEQNIRKKARLTAVYFYTRLIDTIGFGFPVPDVSGTTRQFGGYENQKGGIARGAEFSGRVTPFTSTDIFASYTFTNSDQRQPQVSGSGVINSLGIPGHQFTLVATQRIRKFWVNFDFLGTSSYLAPIFGTSTFSSYVYRFKGNRRGDLSAGYTFGWRTDRRTLRIFGTVENLFDYEYYENGFRTIGRTARAGLSFAF